PTRLENPDEPHDFPPNTLPEVDSSFPPLKEIRSATTELLTSDSLKELKALIQTAYEEHEEINAQLCKARQEDARASRRFKSWDNVSCSKIFLRIPLKSGKMKPKSPQQGPPNWKNNSDLQQYQHRLTLQENKPNHFTGCEMTSQHSQSAP